MASEDRLRTRIALEAARIMAEEGIDIHALAKKKAVARLGLAAYRNQPRNDEIDAALIEHQRLFAGDEQPQRLAHLRKLAMEAMRLFDEFSPLLVGGVWNGSAGKFSPIRLHLFPHAPEDVMRKLWNTRIPFEEKSHTLPPDAELQGEQPALHFYVNDTRIELLLFPFSWKGRSVRRKAGETSAGGNLKDLLRVMEVERLLSS
jgi:hypothetical protein